MAHSQNKYGEYVEHTVTYRSPANIAIAKGVIIGTNSSSKAVYAQTDSTAVVGEAITADSCAAGEYPSVYVVGTIGQILGGDISVAGSKMTTGVGTDVGAPIIATAGAGKIILCELIEDSAVGVYTQAKITYYETGA